MFMLAASLVVIHAMQGIAPCDLELSEAQRWTAASFAGKVLDTPPPVDAIEVVRNHGPVQPNARGVEPLLLGGQSYSRGLYCHAPSRLIVRLSLPATQIAATVGVDDRAGGGSIRFSIEAEGSAPWNSGILRGGEKGLEVSVPLNHVQEFVLAVDDAGDGISCDQADWADARVTLENGNVLWLGDLPLLGEQPVFSTEPMFSFQYGDASSRQFLSAWKLDRSSRRIDEARMEHALRYTDPESGLEVRCTGIAYDRFPVVEWTLHFKNTGTADTPVLSNILPADMPLPRPANREYTLHHNKGDNCTADSYEPLTDVLPPDGDLQLANTGGRPTQIGFPYYNIADASGGLIFVISWTGQWNARFSQNEEGQLLLQAGQEQTHFILHPGEEVRSPLIALLFYEGNWLRGQNLWRAWMTAHNMPHQEGEPLKPQMSLCTGNYYPNLMSDAAKEITFIKTYVEAGIEPDYWWQDAGWYPCDGVGWPKTGTWTVDPVRFPKGLREVGDFARSHGMGTLVWFEPERVHPGTWLADEHPEWVHGGKAGGLLKLGDPECRAWLTDHIDRLITEQKIDFYRQDFNMDPLSHWRANDALESPEGNRQGISEIRHVEGYFAYWDELQRRHPGMPIDSCASGGRRNDLETLRRAVPLLRSDWYAAPAGQQCHTYGTALWFPFTGTGVISQKDAYWMRSSMVAEFTFGPDAADTKVIDFENMRRCQEDWRVLSRYFYGDFYPLTDYTLKEDAWMAWQYHLSEADEGAVQVFRRNTSIYESARLPLHGLNRGATYSVTNVDSKISVEITGAELMEKGLPLSLPEQPQATILVYKSN